MSQVITKRVRLSRRSLLKGLTASGAPILVGLPPLVSMFNSLGTAYAAAPPAEGLEKPIENRFVLWFNGNGIPERYWIPSEEGPDYRMTPCLSPLAPFRADIHVLSGVDNAAAGGMGNGHTNSMSGLMTGTHHTGRGPMRAVDRPGDRDEDRRRLALPLAADRRLAGIVRREHAAEHELVRFRTRPAAGDDSAPAVRPPVRRAGGRLGKSQAQHSRRGPAGCRVAEEEVAHGRSVPRLTSTSPAFATWSAPSPDCLPNTGASILPISTAT